MFMCFLFRQSFIWNGLSMLSEVYFTRHLARQHTAMQKLFMCTVCAKMHMCCATLPVYIGIPSKMKDTAMHHSVFHVLLCVVVMSIKINFSVYITTTQQC